MNKKGFELSVNMIVVLILGIVLLGFGIYFLKTIVSAGYDLDDAIDERIKNDLRSTAFHDGDYVAFLRTHATVNRGDYHKFYLGVLNDLDEEHDFKIVAFFSKAPGIDLTDAQKRSLNDSIIYLDDAFTIKPDEDFFFNILFHAPSGVPRGQYLFDVQVCTSLSQGDGDSPDQSVCPSGFKPYRGVQRLYITIK